jgi:DNA-directed RNA polymerase subunit E'/Rpb7
MSSSMKKKINKKKIKKKDIWMKNILTRKIILPFQSVGSNLSENILKILEKQSYNKCSKEGYIKNKSINILTYSSGVIEENHIMFDVSFECYICHPVEGQLINCQVENITRAGIKAKYNSNDKSPIIVFIARDHHYNNEVFNKVKENDNINIKVIGIRYELNDEFISVLGELKSQKINKKKIKLTVLND